MYETPDIVPGQVTTVEGENATIAFRIPDAEDGLEYQWQVDTGSGFQNIPDTNAAKLEIVNAGAEMNGYRYRVRVGGTLQPVFISESVLLKVYPKSDFNLQNVAVMNGEDATLSIAAVGPGLSYQWYVDETGTGDQLTEIPGAVNRELELSSVSLKSNGYLYRVIVSGAGSFPYASNTIALQVYDKSDFTPHDVAVVEGQKAKLSVNGSGEGLEYQWQVDTTGSGNYENIEGANGSALILTDVSRDLNGKRYRVVVKGSPSFPLRIG